MDTAAIQNAAIDNVDAVLAAHLAEIDCVPLRAAMAYSALGGGKRVRALLTLSTAQLFPEQLGDPVRVAAAIEAVHSYSLIHDDLPAMDDDDMRRGKPSLHRATDEATAILAGDALLTAAFEILSDPRTAPQADLRVNLIADLGRAIGAQGMVAGQFEDMKPIADQAALERVHRRKTGALIQYAVRVGALLGGASQDQLATLAAYAQNLGLAFQIMDDVLDATASSAQLGKTAGKDAVQEKVTFVSLYGLEEAQRLGAVHIGEACDALQEFGTAAASLRQIAQFVIERQS